MKAGRSVRFRSSRNYSASPVGRRQPRSRSFVEVLALAVLRLVVKQAQEFVLATSCGQDFLTWRTLSAFRVGLSSPTFSKSIANSSTGESPSSRTQ